MNSSARYTISACCRRLLVALLLCCGFCTGTTAQVERNLYSFNHLGFEHGLMSQRVYSIVEGKYGEIWISMKNGLARYNGCTLKNYQVDTPDAYSNAGGKVIRIMVTPDKLLMVYDNKGNIFHYRSGIDRFVPCHERFTQLFRELNSQGYGLILSSLTVDHEGWTWCSTSRGLFVIKPEEETIRHWEKTRFVNGVTCCGNQLVVYANEGAYVIDRHKETECCSLSKDNIQSAYYDEAAKQLWLGTFSNGVQLFQTDSWQRVDLPQSLQLPRLPVRDIEVLNDSILMLGIDGAGVYALHRQAKYSYPLFSQDDQQGGVLHGNGIYDILRDSHGNVWMGSYTGGIDVAYPTGRLVESIEHTMNVEQSLMNNGVNSILQAGEQILFATDCGVSLYDIPSKRWRHTLQGNVVLTLCEQENSVLAGTYGGGVFSISPDGSCRCIYSKALGNLGTDYIYSIAKDRQGGLWIGCLDGPLVRITPKGRQQFNIQTVQCISLMPNGHVAIGTANGFYVIDPQSGHATHYFEAEGIGSDVNTYVKSILFTSSEQAWIATDGGGIYAYNLATRTFKAITKADGLNSNCISAMAFDTRGRIVASTDDGLSILYPSNCKAFNINFIPGIKREYNRIAVASLPGGQLIFGSNHGAVVVNPSIIDPIDYKAPLRFSGVRIQGGASDEEKTRLFQELREGALRLNHNQNTLEIAFESICYPYSNDLLYQDILEGFNKEWSEPSSEASVSYDQLPPGSYTLKVRCVSRNSGHLIGMRQLEIHVAQPWWNSWYAWTFYLSLMAAVGWLILKNYRGRLERRYFNEKIDFFVNAAHEIRTPLSLVLEPLGSISNDQHLSERSRKYLDIARANGGKLQTMINELLDFQKADTTPGALHLEAVNLKTMFATKMDQFALLVNDKEQQMMLHCPDNLLVMMDISLFSKLFDNLISNAIKYTPRGGKITLSAWEEGKQVKMEVRDTGIGIPKEAHKMIFKSFYRAENAIKTHETGSGIGLMLARRIVALHHGELTFESKEGEGTAFLITMVRMEQPGHGEPVAEGTASLTQTDEESMEGKEVILFVDDNADMRRYIDMAFGQQFRVFTAADGEEAICFLREHECDLVVSDLVMPRMKGDELCRRIKENHDTSWMPFILLTAKNEKNDMIGGLQVGADDYMTKPFDTEILKNKMLSILANRRRLSNYYRQRVEQLVAPQPVQDDAKKAQFTEETGHDESNAFIDKATTIVIQQMADPDFGIDKLCSEMAMSRTLLYGKLKTLTAQTPQDFIRNIRLQRAATLLAQGTSILEVTTAVGFVNTKHFSTVFKKQFGVPPSKYASLETLN